MSLCRTTRRIRAKQDQSNTERDVEKIHEVFLDFASDICGITPAAKEPAKFIRSYVRTCDNRLGSTISTPIIIISEYFLPRRVLGDFKVSNVGRGFLRFLLLSSIPSTWGKALEFRSQRIIRTSCEKQKAVAQRQAPDSIHWHCYNSYGNDSTNNQAT